MPEEGTGSLSDDKGSDGADDKKDEPKTFTEEEMKSAIADAADKGKKAGASEAYRTSKSALDTAVSDKNKATDALSEFRKKQIENLPEDERGKAMLADIYERLNTPASTQDDDAGDKGKDAAGAKDDPPDADRKAAQDELRSAAKAVGLDPDKLDLDDPKKFFEGIKKQLAKADDDEDNEDESAGGPIDKGTGSIGAKTRDMTKVNPRDLMAKGYKRARRIR